MTTSTRSIGRVLRWIFWLALLLLLLRGPARSRDRSWLVLGVVVGIPVIHVLYFYTLPFLVLPRLAGNRKDVKRRVLEMICATPSLVGPSLKGGARLQLLSLYQVAHEHEKAAAMARVILAEDPRPAGFAAVVRNHLADSLDALGQKAEAEAERARAMRGAQLGGDVSCLSKMAEAQALERANRHAEACTVYEQALERAAEEKPVVRAQILAHLSVTSFNAGRVEETIRWADQLFALDPKSPQALPIRRMAAVAHGNQGRLDEAERHARIALELTTDPKMRAETLALAGSFAMRRGSLNEAERLAREAEDLVPGQIRMPSVILAEVAALRGDFAQAIEHLERGKHIGLSHVAALERRALSAVEKEISLYLAELGRTDEALPRLQAAEVELGRNPKLASGVHAALTWVHALRGEPEAANSWMDLADDGREAIGDDRTSRKSALRLLGRAALVLNDLERAEEDFREYLALDPDPAYRPSGLYFLAECRRRQGDLAGALSLDREAASTDFGLHYERLARKRLPTYVLAAEDLGG